MNTPDLADLYNQYSTNDMFFQRCIQRIPDNAFPNPLNENTASFQWIAAHVANTRCHAANLIGGSLDLPWEEKVGGMQTKYDPNESYPSKSEILEVWNSTHEKFLELLKLATTEQLEKELEMMIPFLPKNVRGMLTFLATHESYHLGQMGMLVTAGGGKGLAVPD